MMLASVTGNSSVPVPAMVDTDPILVPVKEESTNEINLDIEAHVRDYFSDIPILVEVARCESHFTQFSKSGKVLRGVQNPYDVGVMQINEKYHLETSKKLGLDIYTLEGNLAYGRHLYSKNGARDWLASSPCWGGKIAKR